MLLSLLLWHVDTTRFTTPESRRHDNPRAPCGGASRGGRRVGSESHALAHAPTRPPASRPASQTDSLYDCPVRLLIVNPAPRFGGLLSGHLFLSEASGCECRQLAFQPSKKRMYATDDGCPRPLDDSHPGLPCRVVPPRWLPGWRGRSSSPRTTCRPVELAR